MPKLLEDFVDLGQRARSRLASDFSCRPQRQDFAQEARLVFWDQRSHGRSGRSSPGHISIDQLGADLAAVLVHHQIMFASGMFAIRARLLLYRWGVCTVDVTDLVQIFDVMRLELRNLMPTSMAACA